MLFKSFYPNNIFGHLELKLLRMKIRQINLFSYEKGYNIYENVLEKEGCTLKKTFVLATEYITLGQFLKEINVIGSGGKPNGIWQTIACLLMASWKIVADGNFMRA